MNKRIVGGLLVLLMLVSILAFTACSVQRRPGPDQPAPMPGNNDRAQEDIVEAQRLADKIGGLEEVNSATVVVSGTKAWVGVDLKADTKELSSELKSEIAGMVRRENKSIETVYVTADADTVTRIRNISRDIVGGRPISGFMDELNEIGRRITPTIE